MIFNPGLGTMLLLKRKVCDFKEQNPTDMHAQCMLSEEKGKFCFKGIFSKGR